MLSFGLSILSQITSHQIKELFINKLLRYGFVDDESVIYEYKLEVKNIRSYLVNTEFPRLTKKTLNNKAISNATYHIIVNAIDEFLEDLK